MASHAIIYTITKRTLSRITPCRNCDRTFSEGDKVVSKPNRNHKGTKMTSKATQKKPKKTLTFYYCIPCARILNINIHKSS